MNFPIVSKDFVLHYLFLEIILYTSFFQLVGTEYTHFWVLDEFIVKHIDIMRLN